MFLDDHSAILVFLNWVANVVVLINFHIIFLLPKLEGDTYSDCMQLEKVLFDNVLKEWRRNYGSTRSPLWKSLCTYKRMFIRGKLRTNYDLHYVNPVLSTGQEADVAFYVLKYMLKPSKREERLQQALHLNLPEEEYEDIWSVVKSRHFESEAFGLGQCVKDKDKHYVFHPKVLSHLVNGVSRSKGNSSFPCFYSPVTGKSFPLSPYYRGYSEVYSMQDALDFFYSDKNGRIDNMIIPDDISLNELLMQEQNLDSIVKRVQDYDSAFELDDLFD